MYELYYIYAVKSTAHVQKAKLAYVFLSKNNKNKELNSMSRDVMLRKAPKNIVADERKNDII